MYQKIYFAYNFLCFQDSLIELDNFIFALSVEKINWLYYKIIYLLDQMTIPKLKTFS